MSKILCSTGALIGRPNNRDYRLLEPLTKELNCDGFEFMMYSSWYEEIERLLPFLKKLSLDIPVMHCEKHIGEAAALGNFTEAMEKFRINCHFAAEIGARSMVIHLWDGMTSDSKFENNLKAYGEFKRIADSYEVDVLVENVVCNRENPMKHWLELQREYPEVHFVFDTKMAAFHDQMKLLYEKEYEWLWRDGHIRHYHVNDYGGGYMEWQKLRTLPVGQGHVDFEQFFGFINRIGYKGNFTVESTAFGADGSIDTEMLNRQFEYIRRKLA